ncbi:MAG: leucyl aminopeptidase, partial [Rhodospirillaceae bacterium]|nr:leucyl aminopeptidase [Rhodospirillaceae bacterium]
ALFSGGNNIYHGGKQAGKSHFDAILLNATIYLDSEMICEDGEYLF